MVDEITDNIKNNNIISIGLDIGTMNICCAKSDSTIVKTTRNVFLELDPDEISVSELSNVSFVRNEEDNKLFIIGADAFTFANIFSQKISRPMESGLISPKELYAIDVLTLMLKNIIGDVRDKEVYCSYSVPAEAIDKSRSVTYHEKVFGRILSAIGVNHTPVNEAMAIIYSECAKEKFSGIAISFGAGMANTCISYKGIEALKFSTARSGDWIDQNVAESLSMVSNRVTNIKEKNLNLRDGFMSEKNRKTRRILEALEYYYTSLVEYTIKKIIKEFDEKVDIEIDDEIPLVISGGTSLPKGFDDLFKDTLRKYNLPFEISEIRRAKNPLTAVASGLLIKTISDVKNL